jgi:Methyltransferase domain
MQHSDRAIRLGNLTVVAQSQTGDQDSLALRLSTHGYQVHSTPHFIVCHYPTKRSQIVIHKFSETTADEDLPSLLVDELGPVGVITSEQEFGKALFAVVASTSPASLNCAECGQLHLDNPAIWHHYCINTLRRLRLESCNNGSTSSASQVSQFAMIYKKVAEHRVGSTLLDVGSNLGLLPILIAERHSDAMITGCDNRSDIMRQAVDLASRLDVGHVKFEVRDVLRSQFRSIGRFDTVTAIHLLEHFTNDEIEVAAPS